MEINVPELALVVLIGPSGSGKSSFARTHFGQYETVSSDACRGMVANDENDLSATNDAFELLNHLIRKRLKNGLLTVVDATNVQPEARKELIKLAREYHTLPVAIVFDMPESVCRERNAARIDRNFGGEVVKKQARQLKKSFKKLKKEGFRQIYTFRSEGEVNEVTGITRTRLYNNKKDHKGPFDIIGDIHGCYQETIDLLQKLGYEIREVENNDSNHGLHVTHPDNRQVIFLGDLVDRGPDAPSVLKLVMSMVRSGTAWCVPGNHDQKLQRKLNGKDVKVSHGLADTLRQLEREPQEFKDEVNEFLFSLISHYVFDEGNLVVAHAGIKEEMQGRGSAKVRDFCLYGETTGETDEYGLPVRYNWAAEYRGKAMVVYGHTPVPEAEWLNRTINIDTGCVFGGKLTALRYPEQELVPVPARAVYSEPVRPPEASKDDQRSSQQQHDDLLNIDDVTGKRIVQTRLRNNVTIREENSIAALETMSRFAINPKWLIYLPPTMAPCGTSDKSGFLEYPEQAISYYHKRGVEKIVCEEKHMGSRVVMVLCKDEDTALRRFGVQNEGKGKCYSRTGKNFFNDAAMEQEFISRITDALTHAGFWETFQTDWVCLDTELMPWSAKAQSLLQEQYASVGAAAQNALTAANSVLEQAAERGIEGAGDLLNRYQDKQDAINRYTQAYRNYCWPVYKVEDYKLAPFHILATEGKVYTDKDHQWHMEHIHTLCRADEQIFRPTPYKIVDTGDTESVKEATDWWLDLTEQGGEGMVVKPFDFIAYGKDGLLQPAVKCRGKEYLRIIYGPEYDLTENLKRLKSRNLSAKRSLALREFALGVEALERFVRKEPLRQVHESVFGVLALESEDVDPRL